MKKELTVDIQGILQWQNHIHQHVRYTGREHRHHGNAQHVNGNILEHNPGSTQNKNGNK